MQTRVQLVVTLDICGRLEEIVKRLFESRGTMTLKEMSELLGLSESRASHHFSEQTEVSFRVVRLNVKRHIAALLLSRSQMRVNEIATYLGYATYAKFSLSWRKWTGVSPRSFRRSGIQVPEMITLKMLIDKKPWFHWKQAPGVPEDPLNRLLTLPTLISRGHIEHKKFGYGQGGVFVAVGLQETTANCLAKLVQAPEIAPEPCACKQSGWSPVSSLQSPVSSLQSPVSSRRSQVRVPGQSKLN